MIVGVAMLPTLMLTIGLVALLMIGMAVGVIFSDRRLRGSCGGTGLDCVCDEKKRRECELHHAPHGDAAAAGSKLVAAERLARS